ncbi:MAG: glycoside hydrolase family 3 C-terminal domain-containing protein [Clostridia bacterium]|nr:glycoside hydrolase family 3 C-terminal domain-containing protein [Clostridia bacterium]
MYKQYDSLIDGLLSKMTLKEKIGQLNQITGPVSADRLEGIKAAIRNGEVGSIILASSSTAGNDPQGHVNIELYNELQKVAVTESRLKIPMIYGRDVIHGHRTVYPIPLASAAAFNCELLEKCYRDIAEEAAADGIHWTFSPMLDMCHDPRWGRIIEGPGEDPFVGAAMAKACVKGFQGENLADKKSIAACAKHYIGYGASEGGRDYHRTEISDVTLYNYYLPAFKAAVDSGVTTVMSSFNDISGTPVTGGRKYLTDILRGQLKFEGFVVSDWEAVVQLQKQGVAASRAECAKIALEAGLDLDMCDHCYVEELEKLVEDGVVLEETVNTAVRRILRIKFALGLFERPYREPFDYDVDAHRTNARALAAESMVLLKNNGVLPLKKDSKIALMGPFARERRSLLGSWTLDGDTKSCENLYEALCGVVGEKNIRCQADSVIYDNTNYLYSDADVIVLALGESYLCTGENRAVSDISVPVQQRELINKMRATGKKVIGVCFFGRPVALGDVEDKLDAILYAWHSGSQTAGAVCDILFGDTVPSGKTAVTFPRKSTHIPLYYNVTSSGRPVDCYYGENPENCYLDSTPTPLYPFGYGLSYTKFSYLKPQADKTEISLEELKEGKKVNVSVCVENIGGYDGKETVQLYIRDKVASVMRPIRELKGFKKVFIEKGDKAEVIFNIGYEELGFYNQNGDYLLEKGEFDIFVGENCLTENKIIVTVK